MNRPPSTIPGRAWRLALALAILAMAPFAAAAELSLDQAVAEALSNNPRMAEAAARQAAAAAEARGALADYFPKAAAAYNYRALSEDPYVNLAGRKAVINSTQQHHWEVSLVQPLFTGFAVTARNRLAELGLETRELESDLIRLTLAREVKRAYFNLLMSIKTEAVAAAAQDHLTGHAADAKRFYEQGLIPLNDRLKSQVALAEAVQEKVRAGAGVRSAAAALNVLLGRDWAAETTIADVAAVERIDTDLADAMAQALARRPDVAVLARALAARGEEIRLAQSDYYPRVELVGKYEQDGDDLLATHNDYTNQFNTSIGIQARWVFFEAGKTRARAARARSEQAAIQKALESLNDAVRLEVQQAFLDLGVAHQNIATTHAALSQAREHFRISSLSYRQHLTTSTEVLDARAYLTRAETGYYRALYGYGVAAADLDLAMGR